jgi:hypothetical protein
MGGYASEVGQSSNVRQPNVSPRIILKKLLRLKTRETLSDIYRPLKPFHILSAPAVFPSEVEVPPVWFPLPVQVLAVFVPPSSATLGVFRWEQQHTGPVLSYPLRQTVHALSEPAARRCRHRAQGR